MGESSTPYERWTSQLPSHISSHRGGDCCSLALSWLRGMAASHADDRTGRWVRDHGQWGPSRWPLHWCEAAREEVLDCGALAALASLHLEED